MGEIVIETRNQGKDISWYGLLDSMRRIGDFDFIDVLKDACDIEIMIHLGDYGTDVHDIEEFNPYKICLSR